MPARRLNLASRRSARSAAARVLFVVHVERGDRDRILSATYQVTRVLNAVGVIKLKPLRELDAKGELIAPGMALTEGSTFLEVSSERGARFVIELPALRLG